MSRFALLAAVTLLVLPVFPAQAALPTAPVDFHAWQGADLLFTGKRDGLVGSLRGLRIGRPAGTIEHTEPSGTRAYDYGT